MKTFRLLLAFVGILSLTIIGCGGEAVNTDDSALSSVNSSVASLTILQTSDLHDHAGGYGAAALYSPMVTGDDITLGGYSRLASYITSVRNEKGASNTLLCDSGDFTMGTVYTLTLSSKPLAFMFFSLMQYDAITLGNHELDLGPDQLYGFIGFAKANIATQFTTPIIASNMKTNGSLSMGALLLNGTIVQSKIIEKSGIKIGVLGIMGKEAASLAGNKSPLTFDTIDPASADVTLLAAQVDSLRGEGADIVVLLSHEGFLVADGATYASGSDAALALALNAADSPVDVILSGHNHQNHTAVKASADCDTLLVSPGEYGEQIARLDLQIDKATGTVLSYSTANAVMNDAIQGDSFLYGVVVGQVNPVIDAALGAAGANVFAKLGLTGVTSIFGTVTKNATEINQNSITAMTETANFPVGESVLGNLCADSVRNSINGIWAKAYATAYAAAYAANGNDAVAAAATAAGTANAYMTGATGDAARVQVAFVPGGIIRDSLAGPAISFADLYNVLPLGGDPLDTTALGYPLLTAYVGAADLYKIVGLALSMGMDATNGGASANGIFMINSAGIRVQMTTNVSTMGFDVYLSAPDGTSTSPNYGINSNSGASAGSTWINPGATTKYKVALDLMTLMMMYSVQAAHAALPDAALYTINLYDAAGTLYTPTERMTTVLAKRVMTGTTTTMRGWQCISGWAGACTGLGAINLSDAGYTPTAAKRIQ